MNYYKFHIGDYAVHTAHLDLIEDLAYRRLIDLYYLSEAPIPESVPDTARRIRMRGHEAEVQAVLVEFFELCADGWRHSRCDEALAKRSAAGEVAP